MPQRTRKGARSTTPITTTKSSIDKLLKDWGCRKIAWVDDMDEGYAEVHFVFLSEEGYPLMARFRIVTDSDDPDLDTEAKRDADVRGRWRSLLYFLQGSIDGIAAGIIRAEQLFLPWVSDKDGRTVYDEVRPHFARISSSTMASLALGAGEPTGGRR